MTKELQIDGLHKKYIIDEYGNLFDIELQRYKKQYTNRKGYMFVSLYINGKSHTFFIHRLVLMTFNPIEGMEDLQVNHIDGNKQNNYIGNLEWCTQSENQKHAFEHGLIDRKGTKNSQCRLTEQQVIEIANMIMDGIPYTKIMKKYNISKSLLSAIRNKRLWGDLLKDYVFPKSKYSNIK